MSDSTEWSFPEKQRPDPSALRFDLTAALDAVVAIRAEIPESAFTAGMLGTDRGGNGIVIQDGVVLTIGYLITEATHIWITTQRGVVVPGYPLAYDQATGFGLIRALGPLAATPLARGRSADCRRGDRVFLLGHGGRSHSLAATLADKREFAGYWEYLIDDALITTPAHPEWSGSALVNEDGQLLGVGSLLVQEAVEGRSVQGNLSVPIDLLEPILDDLIATGRSGLLSRPWMGLYAGESQGQLVVGGVSPGGPADKAGVRESDLVLEVAGKRVTTLSAFLRAVWRLGPAGTRIPLTLAREGDVRRVELASVDRNSLLRGPSLH
jgi:S1-C subfamily serine protease